MRLFSELVFNYIIEKILTKIQAFVWIFWMEIKYTFFYAKYIYFAKKNVYWKTSVFYVSLIEKNNTKYNTL